jgi:tRNA-dihydrouridine synthase 1
MEEKKDEPNVVDREWLAKLLQRHGSDLPARVLAPMVDQSDLPFRLLTRRYNCNLCFTPMIHAKQFCTSAEYRRKFMLQAASQDRPLIAQLCGSDKEYLVETALAIEPFCDGIDLNCGCPQGIAKRGNYGAFLLEQEDELLSVVRHLVQNITLPISVKVRLLPAESRDESLELSLKLYTKLVDAGIHLLTIHGRTRHHKGSLTGHADWEAIRTCVQALGHRIPMFANGSLGDLAQVQECLAMTGVDGVMTSEAVLEYPAFFASSPRIGRVQLAREYLLLAKQYPTDCGGQGSGLKCMRGHVHKILHADLTGLEARQRVIETESWQELWDFVEGVDEQHQAVGHTVSEEKLSWYYRHRTTVVVDGVAMTAAQAQKQSEGALRRQELAEDTGECFSCLFEEEDEY